MVEGKEKRAGSELIQENTKKKKVDDDKETTELKQCLEIIPNEEEVAIDAIPLAVKSLTGVSTAQRLQRKYAKCLLLLVQNCSAEVNAASENMFEVTTASEYQVNAANSAHMVAASKVPMFKPSEYEIWRMRIEQYIQMIDYALWEVIENGATLPKITTVEENAKKQKVEDDKETVELKQCLEISPDEKEVTIDAIPLAIKSPSIVGWKIYKEGRKSYYQIMRADGKSQTYMIFMLKSFDRQDLEDLYKLVKAKFKSTRLVEDLDLLL
ncbi:hypothetical protein Tco_1059433 [Tanacetum coccineum]